MPTREIAAPRPEAAPRRSQQLSDPEQLSLSLLRSAPDPGQNEAVARSAAPLALAEMAQDQWGMFTRRQAELAGMPTTTFERLLAGGSVVERVAHGVYRFIATPPAEHLELQAAWLQLAPETPAWERTVEQGLVSHRSAAALYGIGELPWTDTSSPCRTASRRAGPTCECG